MDLGTIRGFKTRFHLYTVPGQVYYNASRKLILKGVDGVVFVADSQIERMEANIESMQNLYDNMAQHGYDLTRMPFVIQYNKRDLPERRPDRRAAGRAQSGLAGRRRGPAAAAARSRPPRRDAGPADGRAPGSSGCRSSKAVAVQGDGVFDTLRAISKKVLKALG